MCLSQGVLWTGWRQRDPRLSTILPFEHVMLLILLQEAALGDQSETANEGALQDVLNVQEVAFHRPD